eukprot:1082852-Heterocapsa_arctica.AAC.1
MENIYFEVENDIPYPIEPEDGAPAMPAAQVGPNPSSSSSSSHVLVPKSSAIPSSPPPPADDDVRRMQSRGSIGGRRICGPQSSEKRL